VEGNPKTFKCPSGFDIIAGSPTLGNPVQISYALNGVYGGPTNTAAGQPGVRLLDVIDGNGSSQVMLGWDHSRHPGCATNGAAPPGLPAGLPWPVDDSDVLNHYPEPRHGRVYNVVFCDGHVVGMRKAELQRPWFYVR
jgi:prepilin-type processing-associated H-X9-DG protein